MNVRDLQTKFTSYAEYVNSREWMHEGAYALPRLLVVTSDGAQQSRVIEALEATLSSVHAIAIFVTTSAQVASSDLLSAIWRQWFRSLEPGHRLGQPCRALS